MLTDSEIESLRFHLGYGNIGADGAPYTQDSFLEVFQGVVAPNLSTGEETESSTAITAGSVTTVTPVSMTGITAYSSLVVDTGEQAETVMVRSVGIATFSAYFAKAHSGTYPIATMCGVARLRMLLWDADAAWRALNSQSIGSAVGLKKVDEVEFFGSESQLDGRSEHYKSIVQSIAYLVQVPPKWANGCSNRLEAY